MSSCSLFCHLRCLGRLDSAFVLTTILFCCFFLGLSVFLLGIVVLFFFFLSNLPEHLWLDLAPSVRVELGLPSCFCFSLFTRLLLLEGFVICSFIHLLVTLIHLGPINVLLALGELLLVLANNGNNLGLLLDSLAQLAFCFLQFILRLLHVALQPGLLGGIGTTNFQQHPLRILKTTLGICNGRLSTPNGQIRTGLFQTKVRSCLARLFAILQISFDIFLGIRIVGDQLILLSTQLGCLAFGQGLRTSGLDSCGKFVYIIRTWA
mmetsp:Transcript_24516/g.40610  ORF Transcript_24516/g.40610 Transcript_24516/m.40610 type:complete len:264 (-) Transcript_24516:611-1402(-)